MSSIRTNTPFPGSALSQSISPSSGVNLTLLRGISACWNNERPEPCDFFLPPYRLFLHRARSHVALYSRVHMPVNHLYGRTDGNRQLRDGEITADARRFAREEHRPARTPLFSFFFFFVIPGSMVLYGAGSLRSGEKLRLLRSGVAIRRSG